MMQKRADYDPERLKTLKPLDAPFPYTEGDEVSNDNVDGAERLSAY